MIKLCFFARIREDLDCSEKPLEWRADFRNLNAVVDYLGESEGERWHSVLTQPNVICAVNQTVIENPLDTALKDGDEIAFFPPVTGG